MKKVVDPDKTEMLRSLVYIFIYVAVIGSTAFLLLPDYWYIWGILVVGGVMILVNWHREKTAYRCPNCAHVYEISFMADLFSPHGIDKDGAWLYIRCPNCLERHKTKTLKLVE